VKASHLLTIHPRDIPAAGVELQADVTAVELDLPADDRMACRGPVCIALRVELVRGGILVQGTVRAALHCRCDRCLTAYVMPLEVPDVCHFFEDIEADAIDLTDDLREDILLVFPQHCLCKDVCRGLCARCGQDLNEGDCGCRPESEGSQAWGALDGFPLRAPEKG
jgi:uncharacterized protein